MTVTVASFKQEYPEFRKTSNTLCERKLAKAVKRVAPTVWGTKADDGIMTLTAHLISVSPAGESSRLEPGETTMYLDDFNMMKREVTAGVGRVA